MSKIVKNFSYALFSNGIAFMASAVITLIAPRYMSVESYAYFQLYIFYLTYIGLSCLGWIDGIVLRYGGAYYDKLNKARFSEQFRLFFISQIFMGSLFALLTSLVVQDVDKRIVCILFGVAIILSVPGQFFRYILQGVNRIEEYSKNLLIEKIIYAGLVILALICGIDNYVVLICADLIGKFIALVCMIYVCRDIVFHKPEPIKLGIIEAKENVKVGSRLLVANNAGYLINGTIRYVIEMHWSLIAFVKVSLTLNVSNLLLTFVRVVSMVAFPALKRTDEEKLPGIYLMIRKILMPCLLGMLCFYYPFRVILSIWLPKYRDSLVYMALLFPICVYESKTTLLIETYMKALRKEKWMLFVNCLTMGLSFVMAILTAFILDNLDLTVLSLLLLLAFRCILSELLLEKPLQLNLKKEIIIELIMSVAFIIFSWFIGGIKGFALYIIVYIIYLIYNKKDIFEIVGLLKQMRRHKA